MNTQLENLKKQIESVNKAASGGRAGAARNEDLKKTIALMKESYDAQIKFEKATSESMMKYQMERYNKAEEGLSRLLQHNDELKRQAEALPQIQRLQTQLDEARIASADKVAKAQQSAFDKQLAQLQKEEDARIAAEQKVTEQRERLNQANAQAEYKASLERRERWQQEIDAFKKNTDDTIALIDKKHAANQKAETDAATKVYREQLDIEKQLASGTAGKNETAVLRQQLAEKQAAFSQYSKSIQDAAKADASVVKTQQDIAVAQAKAVDKA